MYAAYWSQGFGSAIPGAAKSVLDDDETVFITAVKALIF